MKVFAVSDIHVDFSSNRKWVNSLPYNEYKDDILILAGDITHNILLLGEVFETLRKRFGEVIYVPGNHDLWVSQSDSADSLKKLNIVKKTADNYGIRMGPYHYDRLSIVPLYGWYDFSFGEPSEDLAEIWSDFAVCKWPDQQSTKSVAGRFAAMNEPYLNIKNDYIISFSHFLPRIDVMPSYIPLQKRVVYPVLGSSILDEQIRKLGSKIHVYGHSHVNREICIDNIIYINNAYGYPYETGITSKKLKCIFSL